MIGNSVVALKKSYFCVQTLKKKRKAAAVFIKQPNTMFIIGFFFCRTQRMYVCCE